MIFQNQNELKFYEYREWAHSLENMNKFIEDRAYSKTYTSTSLRMKVRWANYRGEREMKAKGAIGDEAIHTLNAAVHK